MAFSASSVALNTPVDGTISSIVGGYLGYEKFNTKNCVISDWSSCSNGEQTRTVITPKSIFGKCENILKQSCIKKVINPLPINTSTPISVTPVPTPISVTPVPTPISVPPIPTPISVTPVPTPISVPPIPTPISVPPIPTPISVTPIPVTPLVNTSLLYNQYIDYDVTGNSLMCYRSGETTKQLEELCNNNPSCKSFSYVHGYGPWQRLTGGCLKSSETPIVKTTGVDIWLKKNSTNSPPWSGNILYTKKDTINNVLLASTSQNGIFVPVFDIIDVPRSTLADNNNVNKVRFVKNPIHKDTLDVYGASGNKLRSILFGVNNINLDTLKSRAEYIKNAYGSIWTLPTDCTEIQVQ